MNFRDRLGLSSDVDVEMDPELLRESKKKKKLMEKLQAQLQQYQEDKVGLKLEVKSLKQQVLDLFILRIIRCISKCIWFIDRKFC